MNTVAGGTSQFYVIVRAAGGSPTVYLYISPTAGETHISKDMYVVLEPADQLLLSSTLGDTAYWCSGSLLTGVPQVPPATSILPTLTAPHVVV
jgi:hypothetical protein